MAALSEPLGLERGRRYAGAGIFGCRGRREQMNDLVVPSSPPPFFFYLHWPQPNNQESESESDLLYNLALASPVFCCSTKHCR